MVLPIDTLTTISVPVNRRFYLMSNAFLVTDHRNQIARPAAAQHYYQLRQQARRESLSSNIQIDVSLHRLVCILQLPEDSRDSVVPCDQFWRATESGPAND